MPKYLNIIFTLLAFSKTVKLRGQEYQLELVDTAGQVTVAGSELNIQLWLLLIYNTVDCKKKSVPLFTKLIDNGLCAYLFLGWIFIGSTVLFNEYRWLCVSLFSYFCEKVRLVKMAISMLMFKII